MYVPSSGYSFVEILVIGTLKEAEEVALRLSNWNAGCDYSFYVVGQDGDN